MDVKMIVLKAMLGGLAATYDQMCPVPRAQALGQEVLDASPGEEREEAEARLRDYIDSLPLGLLHTLMHWSFQRQVIASAMGALEKPPSQAIPELDRIAREGTELRDRSGRRIVLNITQDDGTVWCSREAEERIMQRRRRRLSNDDGKPEQPQQQQQGEVME